MIEFLLEMNCYRGVFAETDSTAKIIA